MVPHGENQTLLNSSNITLLFKFSNSWLRFKNLLQQILLLYIFTVYHCTVSLYHCTNWSSLDTEIRYATSKVRVAPENFGSRIQQWAARYPKMCCFICTHTISLMQSINIPLLWCKRYMQTVRINGNAVSVLNSKAKA